MLIKKLKQAYPYYRPLIKANLVVILAFCLSICHARFWFAISNCRDLKTAAFIIAGWFYTHFFEFLHHKFPMHKQIAVFGSKPFEPIRKDHLLLHHGDFPDGQKNYKTRDLTKLQHVTTTWYIFPALFLINYGLFVWLAPSVWLQYTAAFFSGVTSHFLVYETTHYLSHLQDNIFDKMIARVPLVGWARKKQDEHHADHHTRPNHDFNFVPPFLGDRLDQLVSYLRCCYKKRRLV